MDNKVLITGGAGFIGTYLSESLKKMGYNITVLDNLSPQIHGVEPMESELYQRVSKVAKVIIGDVRDIALLKQIVPQHNYIIHLAAETGTGQSMYQISHYSDVNVLGTSRLLEVIAENQTEIKKVIVASSRAIYGEGKYIRQNGEEIFPGLRTDAQLAAGNFEVNDPESGDALTLVATSEDAKIHPVSVYGITKQVQEQLVMLMCESIGISSVALRFQNVYGPGQSLRNPYTGILSIFSTRIRNHRGVNIFEDGLESRDFVYITDVVESIILSMQMDAANGQVFNVGSGIATSVNEVVKQLKSLFDIEVDTVISGNYRVGDIRHNFADLTKIRTLLGFVPKVDFKTGISNFVEWVKSQPLEEDKYELSLNEMKEKGLYK